MSLSAASARAADHGATSPSLRERLTRRIEAALADRCLTPAVDDAFNQAGESGALQKPLGDAFTFTDASARDDRIDLTIEGTDHRHHQVALALQRVAGRTPDGEQGAFLFYLEADGRDPAASKVLLEMASVLAQAIPETALAPCGQRARTFGTRSIALSGAVAEVAILVAALVYGLWVLRDATDRAQGDA